MPSNSPTQLSQTWQQSGGLPAAMEVMSFCRACACGTNSSFTSKSFCAWLKRWTSDSTSTLRLGSGTLNWKRTGAAPHARRGLMSGSSHQARSAAARAPVATMVFRSCRRDKRRCSFMAYLLLEISRPSRPGILAQLVGGSARLWTFEHHEPIGLGRGEAAGLALLPGPRGDHIGGIPLAHLALVLAQGGQLRVEGGGDVDEGVGPRGAVDEDALDVVRLEPLGAQLGEDEPRLRRGEDGVERHVRRHPMVGMIHVALAVEAHRRVPAHHGVRLVPANDAREVPPQGDGGLEHAVLVTEEHDVADTQSLAGPPLL